MKLKSLIFINLILIFILSCAGNHNERKENGLDNKNLLKQSILDSETLMFDSEIGFDSFTNDSIANDLIDKYIVFADEYPEDSLAPEYLYKAAEIAVSFDRVQNSISYLTRIETDYLNFDKYALSIFLKAYAYDNYTNDVESAKRYYSIFIDSFPNHTLIEDAKSCLDFLEHSERNMIDVIKSNNP